MPFLRRTFLSTGALWARSTQRKHQKTAERVAAYVDVEFYLKTNPDVREAGLDPVMHYVQFGCQEGRDPSPCFSTLGYLAQNPQVSARENPLEHFIGTSVATPDTDSIQDVIDTVSEEFDTDYYLRTYPQVSNTDVDPARYFCERGWREGHNPNAGFSTSYYLTTNADVKECGVNPFWHFLVSGRDEGRSPKHVGGWQMEEIAKLKPIEQVKTDWLRGDPPKSLSALTLAKQIKTQLSGSETLISFGHDDYTTIPGGVQLCIGLEKNFALERGVDHLNLDPWQTLPTLADEGVDPVLCLTLNGESIGHAPMSQIAAALGMIKPKNPTIVCHHLAGHSLEGVVELAKSIGQQSCQFWLHDYFAICTSFTLLRNNVAYCGAPDPESNSCQLCSYGAERQAQTKRFEAFFDALDVHLISPSEVALKTWQERSGLKPKTVHVRPHVVLSKEPRTPTKIKPPDRYRIAFIGNPSPHKGWPVFDELRKTLADDDRFEFWMISANDIGDANLTHVATHSRASHPAATTTALADNQIDIVLHWAAWSETFSFSTFEAIAAGAYVITNEQSGNVAAAVRDHQAGCVLKDVSELDAMVQTGKLAAMAEAARAARASQRIRATYSDLTFATLPGEAAA